MLKTGQRLEFTVRRHVATEDGVLYVNYEVASKNAVSDSIIAKANPKPTLDNGIYQDIYYYKGSVKIVFEFEYRVEKKVANVSKILADTRDVYGKMLKSVFPRSTLRDQFVGETMKAVDMQEGSAWKDFDFKVGIDIDDQCAVDAIADYEPKKLVEPTVSGNLYTFEEVKEARKTFVVQYDPSGSEAFVTWISCNEKSPCQGFRNKDSDHKIKGSVTGDTRGSGGNGEHKRDTISIDMVFMGDAQGAGHCSKAVSYMIKVLLIETAKMDAFPYKGEVYISTGSPCEAVNCYSHAFINNGFSPDAKQLKEVKERLKGKSGLTYTFTGFRSQEQLKKYNEKHSIARRVKSRRRGLNSSMALLKF
jgi:hypothetical protein